MIRAQRFQGFWGLQSIGKELEQISNLRRFAKVNLFDVIQLNNPKISSILQNFLRINY